MDTGVDGVYRWNGVLGVHGPENQQSETCPRSSSQDRRMRRNKASNK